MSLSTTVTVHCDGCGVWEEAEGPAGRLSRRRRGWITWREGGLQLHGCPDCLEAGKLPQ